MSKYYFLFFKKHLSNDQPKALSYTQVNIYNSVILNSTGMTGGCSVRTESRPGTQRPAGLSRAAARSVGAGSRASVLLEKLIEHFAGAGMSVLVTVL